jgi:hypothetical protein
MSEFFTPFSLLIIHYQYMPRTDIVFSKPSLRLREEAKSVLSSCGWTDKVDEYMRVKKRLHEKEPGDLTSDVKR